MQKNYVRRSSFERITLKNGIITSKVVEADEVFVRIATTNASIFIATSAQQEYSKFLTATGWTPTNGLPAEIYLDTARNRVQLYSTIDASGAYTTLGSIVDPNAPHIGIKETINFRIHPSSPSGVADIDVILEYVNYVPASAINA